jgi:hypothetical protein
MSSSSPLQGYELIDCARANAKKGIEIAAQRCGYGDDLTQFEQSLRQAGKAIAVEIHSFDDLINPTAHQERGVEVGPRTSTQL